MAQKVAGVRGGKVSIGYRLAGLLPSASIEHMKVLLAEDEYELALLIKSALETAGHTVDLFLDGGEAWAALECSAYDLLVLDWMLPGLSGTELSRKLRAKGLDMPILMLTARDTVDDRVLGLDSGVDDYMVKPFHPRELLARVRALGRRRPRELLPERLIFADIELDTRTFVAYRGGQEIPLVRKEFQLLEYMMRHPRQVLSQEQIFDHLWEMGADLGSNVVAAQIRLLRRKIDAGFPKPLIHTVYGIGYRFDEH
jgi:two-component system, OmpR family, manganese sensing response regulator